ncbi:Non-specific serine/threonine protein kinase [Quillaja saponaria]|uniref:Non-specific serine/threonine protein kinase n=1 Tax=Quillaja saponaria TaxID=32244 RepID=A0AAD7Q9X2_QUISA|nr:Non-specific serine/threonine protein kinase [Quillaja saponaria]
MRNFGQERDSSDSDDVVQVHGNQSWVQYPFSMPMTLTAMDDCLTIKNVHDSDIVEFYTCMVQVEAWVKEARVEYAKKKQNFETFTANRNIIVEELQVRDEVIKRLTRDVAEEQGLRLKEVNLLKGEIDAMGKLIVDYREGLKKVKREFAEYKARNKIYNSSKYDQVVQKINEIHI